MNYKGGISNCRRVVKDTNRGYRPWAVSPPPTIGARCDNLKCIYYKLNRKILAEDHLFFNNTGKVRPVINVEPGLRKIKFIVVWLIPGKKYAVN